VNDAATVLIELSREHFSKYSVESRFSRAVAVPRPGFASRFRNLEVIYGFL